MIERIAFYMGRNDEEPNIDLAILLSSERDIRGIEEIITGLKDKKNEVANDCIKVLYEIGERSPELIAEYVYDFIQLLKSKNNRLVWGGMTALSTIAPLKPDEIYKNIDIVKKAYESGSVITVDNSISVFAKIVRANTQYDELFIYLLNHLLHCKPREVAQHSERAFICVNKENAQDFLNTLLKRIDILTDTQKSRVNKLINKINKGQYPN